MFNDGFATVPLGNWTNRERDEGLDKRVKMTMKEVESYPHLEWQSVGVSDRELDQEKKKSG